MSALRGASSVVVFSSSAEKSSRAEDSDVSESISAILLLSRYAPAGGIVAIAACFTASGIALLTAATSSRSALSAANRRFHVSCRSRASTRSCLSMISFRLRIDCTGAPVTGHL